MENLINWSPSPFMTSRFFFILGDLMFSLSSVGDVKRKDGYD